MEPMGLVEQGFAWGRSRIVGIGNTPLDSPTPCDQWDLRQLVNHTVNAAATIAGVLTADDGTDAWGSGARTPEDMADTDTSWPNPVEQYDEVTSTIIRAVVDAPPDRTFLMNGARQPPIMLARAVTFDSVVHGWDIAKATGQDTTIPADVAESFMELASSLPDSVRGFVFASRVDVPATASPTARLVALLGRHP